MNPYAFSVVKPAPQQESAGAAFMKQSSREHSVP